MRPLTSALARGGRRAMCSHRICLALPPKTTSLQQRLLLLLLLQLLLLLLQLLVIISLTHLDLGRNVARQPLVVSEQVRKTGEDGLRCVGDTVTVKRNQNIIIMTSLQLTSLTARRTIFKTRYYICTLGGKNKNNSRLNIDMFPLSNCLFSCCCSCRFISYETF